MLNRSSIAPAAIASAAAFAVLLGASAVVANTLPRSATVTAPVYHQPYAQTYTRTLPPPTGLTAYPDPLVITTHAKQQFTVTPNADFYKITSNACKKGKYIKSAKYFDYGIFQVTPGKVNTPGGASGPGCVLKIEDTITHATGTENIIVNIPGNG